MPADQLEGLCDSAAYGPLLAALRDAEALGLDIHHGLPRLVEGRSLASADDVAAVLHSRMDRWIQASDPQRRVTADRIVGLFPQPAEVTDPDMAKALQERQRLIEYRARQAATTVNKNRQPCAAKLGP